MSEVEIYQSQYCIEDTVVGHVEGGESGVSVSEHGVDGGVAVDAPPPAARLPHPVEHPANLERVVAVLHSGRPSSFFGRPYGASDGGGGRMRLQMRGRRSGGLGWEIGEWRRKEAAAMAMAMVLVWSSEQFNLR